MKKSITLFLIMTLTSISSFSQTTFLEKIVHKGDTGVFVSSGAIEKINLQLVEGDEAKELADSLNVMYDNCMDVNEDYKSGLKNLEEQNSLKDSIIVEKNLQKDIYKEDAEKKGKQVKRLKIISSITGGAAAVLFFLLLIP